MDFAYAELMEKKESESKSPAFGPAPVQKAVKPHEAKWRTEKDLYDKVVAIAAVEACKAQIESGKESEISFNSQLTFVARQFVMTYEEKFGVLPKPDNTAGILRYSQAALKK